MQNINSIINTHNEKIPFDAEPQAKSCDSIKKPDCPLNCEWQITNITYQGKLAAGISNYNQKITIDQAMEHLN